MPKISKAVALTRALNVIRALTKHFPPREVERLGGKPYTRKEIIDVFASHVEAMNEVTRARVALDVAVTKERASARRAHGVLKYLKAYVQSRHGLSSVAWGEFGWPVPKKPGPKTVASKAEGARKARATRASRPPR